MAAVMSRGAMYFSMYEGNLEEDSAAELLDKTARRILTQI